MKKLSKLNKFSKNKNLKKKTSKRRKINLNYLDNLEEAEAEVVMPKVVMAQELLVALAVQHQYNLGKKNSIGWCSTKFKERIGSFWKRNS